MTISNNYVPLRQLGNGSTVDFSANWNALSAAWLSVNFEDVATGVLTPQLTGWSAVVSDSGFTVTFLVPPPNTVYVVIGRDVDQNQTEPYRTSKGFQGDVLEGALDKLTAMTQDLQDAVGRSVKFQLGSSVVGIISGSPINQAALIFSGTGGTIIAGPTVGQISAAASNATAAAASAAEALAAAQVAQAAASGIKDKGSVRARTTAPLAASTYNNGASGVGATITANVNGALPAQDGVSLTAGQYLLVADEVSQLRNGLYSLTQVGDGSSPWVLTRLPTMDNWTEVPAATVVIEEGSTYAENQFICTANQGGTIGVTAITWGNFIQFIPNGSVTGSKLGAISSSELRGAMTDETGLGSLVFNAQPQLLQPDIVGVPNNSAPAAGSLGEYVSSTLPIGSATALTSATAKTITSISLTAGEWLVWGNVAYSGNASTVSSYAAAGISAINNTFGATPADGGITEWRGNYTGPTPPTISAGQRLYRLNTTTTIYLIGYDVFTTSTMGAYGFIGARRMR